MKGVRGDKIPAAYGRLKEVRCGEMFNFRRGSHFNIYELTAVNGLYYYDKRELLSRIMRNYRRKFHTDGGGCLVRIFASPQDFLQWIAAEEPDKIKEIDNTGANCPF